MCLCAVSATCAAAAASRVRAALVGLVCMCAHLVSSHVLSVHRVVLQGSVWPQPVFGSTRVELSSLKSSLRFREALDGVEGMWDW